MRGMKEFACEIWDDNEIVIGCVFDAGDPRQADRAVAILQVLRSMAEDAPLVDASAASVETFVSALAARRAATPSGGTGETP